MEWDSRKAIRQGQEMDVNRPGSNGDMEDSNDLSEDISCELMDIDSYL